MERLGEDVRRALRGFGGGQAGMAELVSHWPAAVGPQIARNAWPARYGRDGTLHVATSSSAWAFELTNMRAMVLGQLREALGEEAPRAVTFAPGKVPASSVAEGSERPGRRRAPDAAELARAAELASAIADPELRERVAAAAASGLARAADNRRF